MKIALSAGHNVINNGNFDTGSIGNGFREADQTKATVKELIPLLESLGHKVTDITPYNERFTSSKEAHKERAKRVNAEQFDLYIDMHLNAGKGTGTECIVSGKPNLTKDLGIKIMDSVAGELKLPTRSLLIKPTYWSIGMVRCPAIIVEGCFIDTKKDMERFTPRKYALGIAKALGYKDNVEDKKHWAEVYFNSLNEKGVHIDDKRFDDNITRGESFALLDRLTDFVEEKYTKKENL